MKMKKTFKGGFMKRHRSLKAVGFFVVLVAALAFLALPDSQAAKENPSGGRQL